MLSDLWKMTNYRTPIKFIINQYIREYDLSKANINALLYTKRISQEEYDKLYSLDKNTREVTIGLKIQKDPSIYTSISTGIIEGKRRLFLSNELEDINIVSIKNDAVFVVHKDLLYTEFPPFIFNVKNTYTSYIQLSELEVYYSDQYTRDGILNTHIDIKGISDKNIPLHTNGMLDVICNICHMLQRDDAYEAGQYLMDIYDKYVHRALPVNYYRTFDADSSYQFHSFTHTMRLDHIDESMLRSLDINRNLTILRELLHIVIYMYHNRKRFG